MTTHAIKKHIALCLCKARTDIKLIRKYEPAYFIGSYDFVTLVNETLADANVSLTREIQALTLDAYDALLSEFAQ